MTQDKANEIKSRWRQEDDSRRLAAARDMLSTPAGRNLVNHIITIGGLYRYSDALEPGRLAYAAGRRDLCLEILSILRHADPAAVNLAASEREAEKAERDRELIDAQPNPRG